MEKYQAKDVTFLILLRADSIVRYENILMTIDSITAHITTNIYVREATPLNNGILMQMCGDAINYEFIEDSDTILYKTMHFNQMLQHVHTQFVAIWDADAIVESNAIIDCIEKLRKGEADLALPYNGLCLDTSDIIRRRYFATKDIDFLHNNRSKMERLQSHILTGGAVIMNRESFLKIGGENEAYYGWGDDDYDRYIRFMNAGCGIYRGSTVLYHLSHPRGVNSGFNSNINQIISKGELFKTVHKI